MAWWIGVQYLEWNEHGPHQHQRNNQVITPLHRSDEQAHDDGEQCRQDAA